METDEERYARLNAELTADISELQGGYEEVKEVLTNLSKQYETLDVLGTPVKVRPVFTKPVRRMMEFLVAHKEDLPLLEQKAYELLAAMALDAPWTNPKAWEIIDEQSGVVFDLLDVLYEGIGKSEKKIASFRKRT